MVAIMIDERSMLSQIILCLVKQAVGRSAHECGHSGEDWGGIPVMILFGYDYQLPSIGNGGATNIPQVNTNSGTKGLHDMRQCHGRLQFMNLAEEVMDLDQVCRQTDDQVIFKGILERLRLGWMNERDEAQLRVLTLDGDHYTSKEIKDISEGALHLFARHQAKNAYNEQKLHETVTETNPLAVIRCIDETAATNAKSKSTHLNNTFDMRKTILFRDAMVETTKVNIEPNWGLFNGAIGTVVDIIFREGEHPNEGHLLTVVIVDLKHNRGPIWDNDNPTHVPIVPIQRRCEPMCCKIKQIPLHIAWAKKIIHSRGMMKVQLKNTKHPMLFKGF
jgi:hypothetical protein